MLKPAMNVLPDTLDFGPRLDVAARSCASACALAVRENQDNVLLIDASGRAGFLYRENWHTLQLPHWPPGHVRVAVLDGMGGHEHGRQAAEATVLGLLRIPACATLDELSGRLDGLHEALQSSFAEPGEDGDRSGTTLTLLELRPDLPPLLYHVGDSRLYEITADKARPLTVDHVPATALALRGQMGERDWRRRVHEEHHPQISQAFILGNVITDPKILSRALHPLDRGNLPLFLQYMGDRRALSVRGDAVYLLATDGFWACARPGDWIAHWPALFGGLRAEAVIDTLFDHIINTPPPGRLLDNLSAVAIRFRPSVAPAPGK